MLLHDGKLYARVSDILKPFCDFSQIDPIILQRKADIGTRVHQAIESDIKKRPLILKEDELGYFMSYVKWKKSLKPSFVQSEKRYFNDETMLCGQIDTIVRFPDAKLDCLVDFKTSASESKETWPMQAHLYNYLLSTNQVLVGPQFLFVKLDKKGGLPQVFPYLWSENIHAKCMNAVNSFWEKRKSCSDLFSD